MGGGSGAEDLRPSGLSHEIAAKSSDRSFPLKREDGKEETVIK